MEISRDSLKAVLAAIRNGTASIVEAGGSSKLLKLTPGTEVRAEVLTRLENGRFLVKVSGEILDIPLPAKTQVGGSVKMTYLGDQPRLSFAVTSQQAKGSDVSISSTGRWLGSLSSAAQDTVAQKSALAGARIFDALPQDKGAIAVRLKETVARSGLFYESHLERWSNGSYPLKEILEEPQARNSPVLQRPGAPQTPPEQMAPAKGATAVQPRTAFGANGTAAPEESGSALLTLSRGKQPDGAALSSRLSGPAVSSGPLPGGAPSAESGNAVSGSTSSPDTGPTQGSEASRQRPASPGSPPLPAGQSSEASQKAGEAVRSPGQEGGQEELPDAPRTQPSSARTATTVPDQAGKGAHGELQGKPGSDPRQMATAPSGERQPLSRQTTTMEPSGRAAVMTSVQQAPSGVPSPSSPQLAAAPLTGSRIPQSVDTARSTSDTQSPTQPKSDTSPLQQPDGGARPRVILQPPDQSASRGMPPGQPDINRPETMGSPARDTQAQWSKATSLPSEPDSQTLPVIKQQLEFLNTGQFVWQGEAWQGQPLEWAIRRDGRNRQASAARSWQSDLRLELPNLGTIAAAITVAGTEVRLSLSASDPKSKDLMETHRERLIEGMESGGLTLAGMEVRHDPST